MVTKRKTRVKCCNIKPYSTYHITKITAATHWWVAMLTVQELSKDLNNIRLRTAFTRLRKCFILASAQKTTRASSTAVIGWQIPRERFQAPLYRSTAKNGANASRGDRENSLKKAPRGAFATYPGRSSPYKLDEAPPAPRPPGRCQEN